MPAHAPLERLDLRQRRARHDHEGDVALREVGDRAVEMIGEQRTTRAALLPVRAEHEVVDDQLAVFAEKLGQRFLAVRAIEHVILLDFLPGQLAALAAERVARARKCFFLREMRLAGNEPLVMGDDFMRLHVALLIRSPMEQANAGSASATRISLRSIRAATRQSAGVIQPTPAPPGSSRMTMRPTPGTSKAGFMTLAPALVAFLTRASTSSTAI